MALDSTGAPTFLDRLSGVPHRRWPLIGAGALGGTKLIVDIVFYVHEVGWVMFWPVIGPIMLLMVSRVFWALFWGHLLGNFTAQAHVHWLANRRNEARAILRRTGMWTTFINGAWFANFMVAVYNDRDSDDEFLHLLLFHWLDNICLHASMLILLMSILLSGRREDPVQVTEKLWL